MNWSVLRELRERAGVPRRKVAALADLSEVYIAGVEKGRRPNITMANLQRIVRALATVTGVQEDEIVKMLFQDSGTNTNTATTTRR
jgi:transcriptional regulator with XRE-family HTH domain